MNHFLAFATELFHGFSMCLPNYRWYCFRYSNAGHSRAVQSTFFGTQDAKRLRQCENPMIIGIDRGKVWNSNVVVFSFIPFGHKNEIPFFEEGDKSPICGWEKSGWREHSLKRENLRVGKRECRWSKR
ncbi:hypothetical protein AVEN_133180-1 [Araneus ventricosus]|uniref:Uncharacterized protein n=1 Tax=Araneus ventricosus TaxID=182803 RepID=A0A4Y2IIX9_ARAVE|nr:hypothetical protein AVEN_133180-1 [Araneus ventricosus]